jgi:homoserine dehydrogenase
MLMSTGIGLGLLGLGNIGSAVARNLNARADYLERQLGQSITVERALVRDLAKARDVPIPADRLTTDASAVIEDPDVNVIVEMLGGVDPAHQYIRRSLEAGKHVVTANKEVMAAHGVDLLQLAVERGLDLYFEASVGGGIPLIGIFRQNLVANEIEEVHAILNGTTNYVLSQMAELGTDYKTALGEAQVLGYAEPDSTNDVEGHDTAFKAAILATLAFKGRVEPDLVYREGITALAQADFRYAAELGYSIKLLAIAKRIGSEVEVRVHPALVPSEFLLGQVDGVYNAVRITGDLLGRVLFIGQGAGSQPTSSAIVSDLIDLGLNIRRSAHNRIPVLLDRPVSVLPMDTVASRYYLRVWVQDCPGVLASIASICGEHSISIASVLQKEVDPDAQRAELVLLTHEAKESDWKDALERIEALEVVPTVASVIRIEDLVE